MRKCLLSRAVVEEKEFDEQAAMINIYVCPYCRRSIVYVYEDSGVTPLSIVCDVCGNESFSQLSSVKQPTRIWYRPDNMEDLELLATNACELLKANNKFSSDCGLLKDDVNMKVKILDSYIDHYNSGGLFAKVIRR